MTDLIGYVIRGIPFGCVYALVAIGLVLTYKTSGVFNLAFAAQAFVSAAVYYQLRVEDGLAERACVPRRGRRRRTAARAHPRTVHLPPPAHRAGRRQARHLVGSAGGVARDREAVVRFRGQVRRADDLAEPVRDLPMGRLRDRRQRSGDGHRHGDLGGRADAAVPVLEHRSADAGGGGEPAHDRARGHQRRSGQRVLLDALEPVRRSRRGADRAALRQLASTNFTILLVAAIAAAAFARLTSIPMALLGGLLLGILQGILAGYLPLNSVLANGLRPSLPFVLLFLLLLFWPGLRQQREATDPLAGVDPPPPGFAAADRGPRPDHRHVRARHRDRRARSRARALLPRRVLAPDRHQGGDPRR